MKSSKLVIILALLVVLLAISNAYFIYRAQVLSIEKEVVYERARTEYLSKIESLSNELWNKTTEIEKLKTIISMLNGSNIALEKEVEELREKNTYLSNAYSKSAEVYLLSQKILEDIYKIENSNGNISANAILGFQNGGWDIYKTDLILSYTYYNRAIILALRGLARILINLYGNGTLTIAERNEVAKLMKSLSNYLILSNKGIFSITTEIYKVVKTKEGLFYVGGVQHYVNESITCANEIIGYAEQMLSLP
jgi:regulator of replication initiation timing